MGPRVLPNPITTSPIALSIPILEYVVTVRTNGPGDWIRSAASR